MYIEVEVLEFYLSSVIEGKKVVIYFLVLGESVNLIVR